MFDNVGFNVAIGLVFIYLLYSLLVTTIGEYISTKLGIRARLLRIAIERMLNDGYLEKIERKKHQQFQGWLRKFFFYEAIEFKNSVAGRFYEYPAIKYLGRIEDDHKGWFSSTKPSYLSPDYFADALINFLECKGVGSDTMGKIAFCLKFNTHHIQPKTLKQFVDLFERSENNKVIYKQNLIKWFNETMDRANGWHKRKMNTITFYLAFIIAAAFNVDSIRIAKILSKDKEARSQLVNMGIALTKDSLRYKDNLASTPNTEHSKAILDTGLARITKDLNAANFILGLGWNLTDSLKYDSSYIEGDSIINKLADSLIAFKNANDNARKKLASSIVSYSIANQKLDSLRNDTTIVNNKLIILPKNNENDSGKTLLESTLVNDTNEIQRVKANINIISSIRKTDSSSISAVNNLSRILYADINKLFKEKFVVIDSIGKVDKNGINIIYGKKALSQWEKVKFILGHILWNNFIGFLITAFALSLGAPFWFDLLNKLISIRGVGIKPEEKKNVKKESDINTVSDAAIADSKSSAPAAVKEDPLDIALRIYADQIICEKGVVNVIKGYYKNNGSTLKCLQVNVLNDITALEIKTKYKSITIGENELVYLNVVITGKPKLNNGVSGIGQLAKGLHNSLTPENMGSFGCMVRKRDDPKKTFLLSCYHVMNADLTWKNRIVSQDIINQLGTVSNKYEGYLTCLMDTALAEITDPAMIKFYKSSLNCRMPKGIKDISANDVFNTKTYLEGYSTKLSIGLIVNDSSPESFDYPLEAKKYYTHQLTDLIIISHDESQFTNLNGTTHGDSGAIVLDGKNNALGIVVGSDKMHTYVIKIKTIFDFLGLQLITT